MDSEYLSYQKKPGSIPLRKPFLNAPVISPSQIIAGVHISYSKDYKKDKAVLEPAIVYVLSGGEKRERTYFESLQNDKVLSSCVQVLFQSKEGQGLQPFQMDKIWQQGRKRGKIVYKDKEYRLSKIDKVFLVTDVDEFEDQLVKILSNKGTDDNGQWIISNPCIEIWLYYCYKKDLALEMLKLRYVKRAHRSQKMKQLNNSRISGGADPRVAFANTPAGIANSKLHYRTGHYGIPGLFATSFHIMMEQIFAFINEKGRSFAEYQEAKRKKIEFFLTRKRLINKDNY